MPIPAIITAAASLGTAIASGVVAKKQQKRANQFSLEQQDKQNAYNSASAQMARFKEAGLNPNLIYGQVNNTPSVGADYQLAKYDNMLNAITQIAPLVQDVMKTDAQIKVIEHDANIKQEQLHALQRANRLGDQYEEEKWLKLQEEINNLKKSGKLSDKQLEYYDDLSTAQINLMKAQKANAEANTKRANQDYEYYDQPTQKYTRNMGAWETFFLNFLGEHKEEILKFLQGDGKITMPDLD